MLGNNPASSNIAGVIIMETLGNFQNSTPLVPGRLSFTKYLIMYHHQDNPGDNHRL
jgi:hypothetical protein